MGHSGRGRVIVAAAATIGLLAVVVWYVWFSPAAAVARATEVHSEGGASVAAPTPSRWATVNPMPTARFQMAAAAGHDGQIYTFGGFNTVSVFDTVEVFNPSTGTWTCSTGDLSSGCTFSTLTPMPMARSEIAAATGADGRIWTFGGWSDPKTTLVLDTVEVYNPSTNTWTCSITDPDLLSRCASRTLSPMPTARSDLAAATVPGPNGLIYLIGGVTNGRIVPAVVEAYNPNTNTWTCSIGDMAPGCTTSTSKPINPMPTARFDLAAETGPDGLIYAVGGSNYIIGSMATVEVYDPSKGTWACSTGDTTPSGCTSTALHPMPTARFGLAGATGPDGRIYAIGGRNSITAITLNTVEAYTPTTDTWTTVDSISPELYYLAATTGLDGRIYAIGGYNGQVWNAVQAYTFNRVFLPVVDVFLPTPTPVSAFTPTPTATPIPNPIQNGGFENGLQGWTTGSTGGVSTPVVSTVHHSGNASALLGNPSYDCNYTPSYGDSYVSQQINLPSGSLPTLTFYFDMVSQDKNHDGFAVYANNLDSFADRLFVFTPNDPLAGNNNCPYQNDYGWQIVQVTIPAQYLGKPLTLYFTNETTDQYYNTWTYLDDVSISFP